MYPIQFKIEQKDVFQSQSPLPIISSSPIPQASASQQQTEAPSSTSSSSSSSSSSRFSPAILVIIIILAVVFFISGILHLLIRFLSKHRSSSSISESNRYTEMSSGSGAFTRQLQQLFHLHDSGLDQDLIDALPLFFYKELKGIKEPFDCAVCLCEFTEQDKLRLLPLCSHAFHIECIDTWLLSNSTCPLCRGSLYTTGIGTENPVFEFDDPREADGYDYHHHGGGNSEFWIENDSNILSAKRVFSVRLGKFRSTNGGKIEREGETSSCSSSSNMDARRCFSMGSYQYVVSDLELQVALSQDSFGGGRSGRVRITNKRGGQNRNDNNEGDGAGKRISFASKGESFSVSKIWLWSKKSKLPSSADKEIGNVTVAVSLPKTGDGT